MPRGRFPTGIVWTTESVAPSTTEMVLVPSLLTNRVTCCVDDWALATLVDSVLCDVAALRDDSPVHAAIANAIEKAVRGEEKGEWIGGRESDWVMSGSL